MSINIYKDAKANLVLKLELHVGLEQIFVAFCIVCSWASSRVHNQLFVSIGSNSAMITYDDVQLCVICVKKHMHLSKTSQEKWPESLALWNAAINTAGAANTGKTLHTNPVPGSQRQKQCSHWCSGDNLMKSSSLQTISWYTLTYQH